jgi:hypothetical protein
VNKILVKVPSLIQSEEHSKKEFNMVNNKDVFCESCSFNFNSTNKRVRRECQVCAKVLCGFCAYKFYQVGTEESGLKCKNWFIFCKDCYPGRDAYKWYTSTSKTSTPSNNNINKNEQKIAENSSKLVETNSTNDSGYFPESPIKPNEQRVMKMLEKITKQCDDIKQEFNIYRQTTQQEISELRNNVKQLMKTVEEQRDAIEVRQHESKTMKTDLYENITNYIQQQQLSNTIEISGLANSSPKEDTENVMKIAALANVSLKKQQITSTRRLKNGKISVTITEREKCNDLISASFKKFIKNPTKSSTNATKTERIFISNALTTTNQRLYKQLRDLKAEGTIDRISFFDGTFSVHQPGLQHNTKVFYCDQIKSLTKTLD